jgi:hypothetical protein
MRHGIRQVRHAAPYGMEVMTQIDWHEPMGTFTDRRGVLSW